MKSALISLLVCTLVCIIVVPFCLYIFFFTSINYIVKFAIVIFFFFAVPWFLSDTDKLAHKLFKVRFRG